MNATSPHGLHTDPAIFEQTGHEWCWYCGAEPDMPCPGCGSGFHLARLLRAHQAHRISAADVLHAAWPEFGSSDTRLTGATVVPDPRPEATP